MNSADYVAKLIADEKAAGKDLSLVTWDAGLACVGWAYVFGARGEYCTPANRRRFYASKGADHPTIKSACKNFEGTGSCTGCKWFPSGCKTRFFDCRGYTYYLLKEVYNWELMGTGATSQWSNGSNWKAKGTIDTMPQNTLVCLFVKKGQSMSHTGFGFNNETLECSNGVQHFTTRNKKWTHWGLPVCVSGDVPVPPGPEPVPKGYAEVTGKNVALRKDPSTCGTIITRIATGQRVKLEDFPKYWDYVAYKNYKGWMMREFLKEEGGKAVVTGKRVALRKDRSTRSSIYTRVNTGETVQLATEPPEEWDYVSYGGNKGYMMKEFLREGS